MSTLASDAARALASLWSPAASNGQSQAIEAIAKSREVMAGQAVFRRHERARCAVLLAHGRVALGIVRADAGFEVERIEHAPAWLDPASVWLGSAFAFDARAVDDSVVVELPQEPLRQLLLQQPALALRAIQGLARGWHEMASQTSGLMHRSAPARLAYWLRGRAKPSPAEPGRSIVALEDRKRDLAAQLAIAPETLSRLLRRFEQDGVIAVAGYTVRVLDRAALERLSRL